MMNDDIATVDSNVITLTEQPPPVASSRDSRIVTCGTRL